MKFILFTISILFSFTVIAQTTYPLAGTLKNKSTNEPVVGATIFIVTQDSNLAAGAISDAKGKFQVKLKRGLYTIKINYSGMKQYEEELRFWRDDYLGTIYLEEGTEDLKGVEVKRKAPQASVDGDTTSYSAKAFKTNKNANAADLIKKMPGMQEDNGELKAEGEKVKQVLVDGKSFFGQDPNAALNTLPAEVVDKIQVFDDQSEKSKASGIDDGTRIKTVNIVTKINMRNGEFGKVYTGGATDSKFSAGGNINKFKGDQRISLMGQINNINQQNFSTEDLLGVVGDNSGKRGHKGHGPGGKRPSFLSGFAAGGSASDFMVNPSGGITETVAGGINYQDNWGKKIDVSSSYFYNSGDNNTTSNTFQNYFLPNASAQTYTEKDSTISSNVNHKLNAKLVFKLNPKTSFYYIPSVSVQQNSGTSILQGETSQEASIINALNQTFTSDLTGINFKNNLMFRLNGEKRGRSLFVQAKYNIDKSDGDKYLASQNQATTGIDVLNQTAILDENTNEISGSVMLSEPLNAKGLGAMFSYDVSNSMATSVTNMFSNALGGVGGFYDTLLSSNFTNDWITHRPGIGIRQFGRKGGFVARLTYQYSDLNNVQSVPLKLDVNRDYHAILPFVLYRKRFKNKASWFSMYRTYTVAPQASQLTNAIDNSNPLQVSTGNSQLNQQYGHWIMSKYKYANPIKSTIFYVMVNGGLAKNYIGSSTFTARNDTTINGILLTQGSQLSSPVNLNNQYTVNSFVTYGFPVSKLKSNLNLNLSAGIINTPTIINNRESVTFNQNYGFGLVLSSNISENIDFTISTESAYNMSSNSLDKGLNTQYVVQSSKVSYDWVMPLGITFRTKLQHQKYFGMAESLDNNILLWTAGIGKQVFKNQRGEVQLSMYDILGQNNNIAQNFYNSYYEETNSNVLTRYIMLSFSYNIRNFREDKDVKEPLTKPKR